MMAQEDYDTMQIHKNDLVVLVGDTGTGKTNILEYYTKGRVSNNIMPTVALEFTHKLIKIDNKAPIKAQIWDTSGQQQYRSLTMNYYNKVIGALIVFDVSRRQTYEHVPQWLQALRERADDRVQIGLVGNKIDLGQREVSKQQAELYAAKQHIIYSETTIQNFQTIKLMFTKLFKSIVQILNIPNVQNKPMKTNPVTLTQNIEQTNYNCSC